MLLVALTGGIASGKTTVAKMLVALGAEEIDADQVAREVVEPGTIGLEQIRADFGESVIADDGSLNREALASLVFADPNKREQLESILHPLIKTRTAELIAASNSEIVLYTVPLLVESGVDHSFDFVITVESGREIQLERLQRARGLSATEAQQRLTAQATREQRESRANSVIDSSGSMQQLEQQVGELWTRLKLLAAEKHAAN